MERLPGIEFSEKLDEALINDHECLKYIGTMNFKNMALENLIDPLRGVELSDHRLEQDGNITDHIGQIKKNEDGSVEIDGIGRKMEVTKEFDRFTEG